MIQRFQTLLSNSTCAVTFREAKKAKKQKVINIYD